MEKRLYRKTRDRVFGGVCSGLAEYAQVDKGLLRFLMVVAILVTGVFPGLIAYVVCVLMIPTEEAVLKDEMYRETNGEGSGYVRSNPENTRMVIGIALILIGAITLAKLLFDWIDFRYAFPAALVIIGAVLVYQHRRSS
ncbi:MAG TPA: PspC domain-containing protein [Ruminiclostridium sp.]|nr:PspC domain-containing protein [Clostridiaceae bacterium]HAA24531.1 PspC domain-containing protein [Ruminiclostridium sp.]